MDQTTRSKGDTVCIDLPLNEAEAQQTSRDFSLNVMYVGQSRLELRGTVTGQVYRFSTELPIQRVDLRDAKFLLASPLFTISQ